MEQNIIIFQDCQEDWRKNYRYGLHNHRVITVNGELLPQGVLAHSNRVVWWKCKRGHHWKTKVQNRVKGAGCPYCHGKTPIRTRLVK